MAKISIQAGSTGVRLPVFVQASTATDGSGLTGLTGTSTGLAAAYYRGTGTDVPVALTTSSLNADYTSGLFVEVNSSRMPGVYRFDPPDAAFTTGSAVKSCVFVLKGGGAMAPVVLEIELTAWNNQDATAGGINNLLSGGTLGSVSNVRGTATAILASGTHAGAVIPQVQTASNLTGTVVLAQQIHTGATIPVVQTASALIGTVVLAGQVHTGAIVPIVQTASNLVSGISGTATVILAAGTHTGAVIPQVQTASNLTGTVVLAGQVHTGAVIPIVQTASGLLSSVTIAPGLQPGVIIPTVQFASSVVLSQIVHTGAIIPQVQTASNLKGTVVLAAQTHTSAVIPSVLSVTTAGTLTDGRIAYLDAQISSIPMAVGTSTRAESFRGTGVGGSIDQLLYEIAAQLGESTITSTGTVVTKNLYQSDHVTTAARFDVQVDTSTNPTGINRSA